MSQNVPNCISAYSFEKISEGAAPKFLFHGVLGWRSGESTRLPSMWPGFNSRTPRLMWVEFVGSPLCSERLGLGLMAALMGYSAAPRESTTF